MLLLITFASFVTTLCISDEPIRVQTMYLGDEKSKVVSKIDGMALHITSIHTIGFPTFRLDFNGVHSFDDRTHRPTSLPTISPSQPSICYNSSPDGKS